MSVNLALENLSIAEKLELMERIWADLERTPDEIPSPEWHGDVLAERLAEVDAGKTEFVDWEIAKKRLLNRHK